MSVQLPHEIKAQLEKLSQMSHFVENLSQYLASAISLLTTNIEPSQDSPCPTSLLLALSHCLSNNLPLSALADSMPDPLRTAYLQECSKYECPEIVQFWESKYEDLSSVRWELQVQNCKEIWSIVLGFQSGKEFGMRVSYEQLSILVFRLGQAVAYVQNYQIL